MAFDKYVEIIADLEKDRDFSIQKGKAKAIDIIELNQDYYKFVNKKRLSRDFDIALEERVNKPLKEGLIHGKYSLKQQQFDDRKLRYDKCEIINGSPVLHIGPTHFYEQLNTCLASVKNKNLFEHLTKKGIQNFNDKRAYFSDAIGVNAIIETSEGYALTFQRSKESLEYKEYWHTIAGYIDTDFKFFKEKEPSKHFKKLIDQTTLNELKEEVGLTLSCIQRLGILRDSLGVNFTYIAKTDQTIDNILDSFKNAKDSSEHSKFQKLKPKELSEFLINEQRIVPIAFGSLLLYLKSKDRNLYNKVVKEAKHMKINF